VRTLRTLALLDLESHPAPAPIDRVAITIDPTPGRILQHTLFTRPVLTAEQVSTLLARLHALMGQDRVGAAALVDSYRPGAFEMRPFATDHETRRARRACREMFFSDSMDGGADSRARSKADDASACDSESENRMDRSAGSVGSAGTAVRITGALRRCRKPVPARVAVDRDDRPVRVTTDRRGFAGGAVTSCTGPWRTSGDWWATHLDVKFSAAAAVSVETAWNRDEWDVALGDGGRYRIFRDRVSDAWFIDSILD
jgi:protein ImuB